MVYQGRRPGRGYTGGGRGTGRSQGRGYRGNRSNTTSSKTQQREVKFSPQNQGKANYATYATVKEAVVNHIQKSYKGGLDVAKGLKDMSKVNLSKVEPKRGVSTEKVDTDKAMEQTGFDIKYQEELRWHIDRKDALEEGMNKAYALIVTTYCTRSMQSRIEEHPEFTSKIEDDPIAVLEAIQTLMHDPVRAQYPMTSMTDALCRLVNVKQADSEDLLDYVKRFKQLRDVAKNQLGSAVLNTFVSN